MRIRSIAIAVLSALLVATAACDLAVSPVATPTPGGVPVTGGTGTPSMPEVSVTSPTNCRTGPSTAFDLVFTANPGPRYTIIGVYSGGNYWIIDNPAGGVCWLWAQNAVVAGNTAGLPVYPAPTQEETEVPPLPKPSAPGNLAQSRTCMAGVKNGTSIWIESVTLNWNPSARQTGYHIYKNNSQIANLPAGATAYFIQLRYDQAATGPQFDMFGVEAFNSSGGSPRVSVDVPRCP